MTIPGRHRPLVIGLTGPIAAGKSQVSAFLAELGAEVIDADAVYRELISPPSPLLDQVAQRFGPGILHADGTLDRAALGKIVFRDPGELADLEEITHPAVITEVRRRLANSSADVVVNEAIRLVESGMVNEVDVRWLVDAAPEVRLQRLMARNSLDEETARARLVVSQPSLPEGLSFDEVVDNSGSLEDTRAAVQRAWERLPRYWERSTLQEGSQFVSEPVKVDVYFDYACPFADSAARWANELRKQIGDEVQFEFKFFPLEQVNAPADVEEAIWDLPRENRSPARHSMQAGAAALQQGTEAFDAFNLELMKLKHSEGQEHGKRATIMEAARRAGLNLTQFEEDLADDDLLDIVREHYEEGVTEHGVFGTPTFVFPSGAAAYLQVLPAPTAEEAVPLWREFVATTEGRPNYREFKRPRRPAR